MGQQNPVDLLDILGLLAEVAGEVEQRGRAVLREQRALEAL
jgi:hypothetical protein